MGWLTKGREGDENGWEWEWMGMKGLSSRKWVEVQERR